MKFIRKLNIQIPKVDQEFELGDLTIFIGRSNCGKTRILKEIYKKAVSLRGIFGNKPPINDISRSQIANRQGVYIGKDVKEDIRPFIVESPRTLLEHGINAYTVGLNRINESSKKMDPTIIDFGNHGVKQIDGHKTLDTQGSGIQNMMQIVSMANEDNNFLLIDEPEISQFPGSKIEILKRMLELLEEGKQIIFATHDPTLINQYIIKKILSKKEFKIVIHAFCGDKFEKIDFDSDLDAEIHVGYLNQTFSSKPIHLIVEGQTEFYAFQALLYKYCLEKNVSNFPKFINKINIGYLAGDKWRGNIHHLPPPEYYTVLMVLDGEHRKNIKEYKFSEEFKVVDSIKDIEVNKINIFCLKAKNIEEAMSDVSLYDIQTPNKPVGLSNYIWDYVASISDLLKKGPKKSKQIYEIVEWVISKAKQN